MPDNLLQDIKKILFPFDSLHHLHAPLKVKSTKGCLTLK